MTSYVIHWTLEATEDMPSGANDRARAPAGSRADGAAGRRRGANAKAVVLRRRALGLVAGAAAAGFAGWQRYLWRRFLREAADPPGGFARVPAMGDFARASRAGAEEFPWGDLDTDAVAPCGYRKCFFRRRAGVGGEPAAEEGYLVAKECTVGDVDYGYETDLKAWHVARDLEREVGLRHFFLAPPRKVALPAEGVVARLNAVALREEQPDHEYYGNRTKFALCRLTSLRLVVQKVRLAPRPHLIPKVGGLFWEWTV